MNRNLALAVTGTLMLMAACKPGTPSKYIQPDDMEDILVDYHLARALAMESGNSQQHPDYLMQLYVASVLQSHGVTREQFDSSLLYYYTRSDRFDPIYQRVAERLEERALTMGATEGDIGKYANFNATGDTANIWPDRSNKLLLPTPPYNRWDFDIEADTTYHRGDALMMQFTSNYMYQTGRKEGTLFIATDYEDTTVSRSLNFSVSGLSQLRVPELRGKIIKRIRGFFHLGKGGEPTTATRLLFLDNVQLIRFHTSHDEEEIKTDSISPDSIGQRLNRDSASVGNTGRGGLQVVPLD